MGKPQLAGMRLERARTHLLLLNSTGGCQRLGEGRLLIADLIWNLHCEEWQRGGMSGNTGVEGCGRIHQWEGPGSNNTSAVDPARSH